MIHCYDLQSKLGGATPMKNTCLACISVESGHRTFVVEGYPVRGWVVACDGMQTMHTSFLLRSGDIQAGS